MPQASFIPNAESRIGTGGGVVPDVIQVLRFNQEFEADLENKKLQNSLLAEQLKVAGKKNELDIALAEGRKKSQDLENSLFENTFKLREDDFKTSAELNKVNLKDAKERSKFLVGFLEQEDTQKRLANETANMRLDEMKLDKKTRSLLEPLILESTKAELRTKIQGYKQSVIATERLQKTWQAEQPFIGLAVEIQHLGRIGDMKPELRGIFLDQLKERPEFKNNPIIQRIDSSKLDTPEDMIQQGVQVARDILDDPEESEENKAKAVQMMGMIYTQAFPRAMEDYNNEVNQANLLGKKVTRQNPAELTTSLLGVGKSRADVKAGKKPKPVSKKGVDAGSFEDRVKYNQISQLNTIQAKKARSVLDSTLINKSNPTKYTLETSGRGADKEFNNLYPTVTRTSSKELIKRIKDPNLTVSMWETRERLKPLFQVDTEATLKQVKVYDQFLNNVVLKHPINTPSGFKTFTEKYNKDYGPKFSDAQNELVLSILQEFDPGE